MNYFRIFFLLLILFPSFCFATQGYEGECFYSVEYGAPSTSAGNYAYLRDKRWGDFTGSTPTVGYSGLYYEPDSGYSQTITISQCKGGVLRGKSSKDNIKVKGVTFIGCEPVLDDSPLGIPCSTDPPPPVCEANQKSIKELECGGAEYLASWDDTTCSGECFCEGDGLTSYTEIRDFCGGDSKVKEWSKESCYGSCDNCADDYEMLEYACQDGGLQIKEFDWDTCNGSCTDDCSDEYEMLETDCGLAGIANWDEKSCSGECKQDCTTEYNALEKNCGVAGIVSWNDATCSGACDDCGTRQDECSAKCGGSANVKNYKCDDVRSNTQGILALTDTDCECGSPGDLFGSGIDGSDIGSGGFGKVGDYGGETTVNADGSTTESLADGTTIRYSKDGNTINWEKDDGTILRKQQYDDDNDGVIDGYVVESIDAEGNFNKEVHVIKDGMDIVMHSDTGKYEGYDNSKGNTTNPTTEETIAHNGPRVTTDADGTVSTTIDNGNGTSTTTVVKADGSTSSTVNPDAVAESSGPLIKGAYVPMGEFTLKERVDFNGFHMAVASLHDTGPFRVADEMNDIFSVLSAEPEVPDVTVPIIPAEIGLGAHSVHIDLHNWEGVAKIFRFFIGVLFLVMCFNYNKRVWVKS